MAFLDGTSGTLLGASIGIDRLPFFCAPRHENRAVGCFATGVMRKIMWIPK